MHIRHTLKKITTIFVACAINGATLPVLASGSTDWLENDQPIKKAPAARRSASAPVADADKGTSWIDSEQPVRKKTETTAATDSGTEKNDQGPDWIQGDQPKKPQPIALLPKPKVEKLPDGGMLLKGQATYCVPTGTPIKLKISAVPTSNYGMRMAQRDLDGKLFPAKLDEQLTAKTTEDIFVDDNKVIPQGTVFHGRVSKVFQPKRVGRPGSLELQFERFTTPDGREFAFKVQANNTRESTTKSKVKGFGRIAAHAGGGAALGAIIAYSASGMQSTIAMHGYNIAAGAAAGALFGTAVAIMKHGPQAVLEPGDDLNMEIDTDLLIPAATAPTVKAPITNFPGLQISVLRTKIKKDGLDGYDLTVDANVNNNTNIRLQSIDLYVEDENANRYQVGAGDEDGAEMLFNIDPFSERMVKCNFSVEFNKVKHKLVWLDHKTRQVLYQTKL